MDTLTHGMRDAASDAPTSLDDPGWARTAWVRGRRRRAAHRAGAAAAALAALAVVAGLVLAPLGLPRPALPAGERTEGVSSYPSRVGHQWWVRDLPGDPGPMAALVLLGDGDTAGWQALSADGTRYRLASRAGKQDVYPVISDDGRLVATAPTSGGSLVVRDLDRGSAVALPDVALDPDMGGPARYAIQGQSPGWFSPSGDRLALLVSDVAGQGTSAVALADTGTGRSIVVPGMQQAAGWRDDTHLVGRAFVAPLDDTVARVVEYDTRTGRTTPLFDVPAPAPGPNVAFAGQWWGRVDGDTLVLVVDAPIGTTLVARHLPDGTARSIARVPGLAGSPGALSFYDLDVVAGEVLMTVPGVVGSRNAAARVVVEPGVDVSRTRWARDALAGDASPSLFGTSTWVLTWWWREIVLAVLALGLWRFGWRRRGRSARRVLPVSGGGPTGPDGGGRAVAGG